MEDLMRKNILYIPSGIDCPVSAALLTASDSSPLNCASRCVISPI